MMRLAAVVVVTSACNTVYGLEATIAQDAFAPFDDADRDGIADGIDNCPAVANADQQNVDGDTPGDACDGCTACEPCDVGPDHDEDADKIPDGCDPCPADAGTGNTDGDELGDACDHGASRRFLFDGFGTLTDGWLEDGARWIAEDDRAHPDPDLPSSPYALQYAMPGPSGGSWFVEVGIATPKLATNNIGIDPRSTLGQPSCYLARLVAANEYRVIMAGIARNFTAELPDTVVLRLQGSGPAGGQQTFTCAVVGFEAQATSTFTGQVAYPLAIRLAAENRTNAFTYVLVGE